MIFHSCYTIITLILRHYYKSYSNHTVISMKCSCNILKVVLQRYKQILNRLWKKKKLKESLSYIIGQDLSSLYCSSYLS